MTIWEGGSRVVAFVKDGISALWDGMKSLGQWLWTSMVSLYEKIVNFFEDLADITVDLWNVVKYLVAPLILIAVYGGTVGVMKTWLDKTLNAEKKGYRTGGEAS